MNIQAMLKERVLILDGAMGTELMRRLSQIDRVPEAVNLENPQVLIDVHKAYIDAGADIIETNTFGANRIKLAEIGLERKVKDLNLAAAEAARKARGHRNVLIAGSMGPVGQLIRPLGDMDVESVYEAYAEQARFLAKGGVDLLVVETQIDILEAKTALRACRDVTDLPVGVSMSFPLEGGRTVTGSEPEAAAATFSSVSPEFIGINCGGDPEEFEDLIGRMRTITDKPPEAYSELARKFYASGARVIGGCCGTTPDHIKALSRALKGQKPGAQERPASWLLASSRSRVLTIGGGGRFRIIGENINPFGRTKLRSEIEKKRLERVRDYARKQA
ncbi:MAG: homocysteine S-methyltransferase family protein, partial [Candidatus Aminicenantales bacterium]